MAASVNAASTTISHFNLITLSGKTNRIGDSGSALTFNGTPVGGAALWTSAGGVLSPSPAVNFLQLQGTIATLINTNAQIDHESFGGVFMAPPSGSWLVPMYFKVASTNGANEFFAGGLKVDLFNPDSSAATIAINDSEGVSVNDDLYVADEGPPTNQAIEGGDAKYGIVSRLNYTFDSPTNQAQSAAIWASNTGGDHGPHFGVTSQAYLKEHSSGIGLSGGVYASLLLTNANPVALYGEIFSDAVFGPQRVFEPATLLLDSRDGVFPLIVGRTNNGTTTFRVGADGALTAGDPGGGRGAWKLGKQSVISTVTNIIFMVDGVKYSVVATPR